MSAAQKFGQVIAIAILSLGPVAAALGWMVHIINDSESLAGTLAVNSVIALALSFMVIGAMLVLVLLVVFWVWVFGIAWSSDETKGKVDVE